LQFVQILHQQVGFFALKKETFENISVELIVSDMAGISDDLQVTTNFGQATNLSEPQL
jgi:hypothetical protein